MAGILPTETELNGMATLADINGWVGIDWAEVSAYRLSQGTFADSTSGSAPPRGPPSGGGQVGPSAESAEGCRLTAWQLGCLAV